MNNFYSWLLNRKESIAQDNGNIVYRKHPDGSPCHAKDPKDCPIISKSAKVDSVDDLNDAGIDDAAYMEAVKNGDMETCAKMVREAAAKAMPNTKIIDENGFPKIVYHGTASLDFTMFDDGYIGSATGNKGIFGKGHYFTDLLELAKQYGYKDGMDAKDKRVLACFLNIEKVFDFDDSNVEQVANEIDYPKKRVRNGLVLPLNNDEDIERISKKMRDKGFCGSCKKLGNDKNAPSEFVSFYGKNIKSADPITYDDLGNTIPLSKRFDFSNPDIRY